MLDAVEALRTEGREINVYFGCPTCILKRSSPDFAPLYAYVVQVVLCRRGERQIEREEERGGERELLPLLFALILRSWKCRKILERYIFMKAYTKTRKFVARERERGLESRLAPKSLASSVDLLS